MMRLKYQKDENHIDDITEFFKWTQVYIYIYVEIWVLVYSYEDN